jgi:hypothetical protein
MSSAGQAIAYSAPNRVIFLSKVVRAQVSGVFQQHRGFVQRIGTPTLSSVPMLRNYMALRKSIGDRLGNTFRLCGGAHKWSGYRRAKSRVWIQERSQRRKARGSSDKSL